MSAPIDFGRRVWRVQHGALSFLVDVGAVRMAIVVSLLALAVTLLVISGGELGISVTESLGALIGKGDAFAQTVVREWRLPRALAALLFGAMLGLAGAIFQSAIRNPLGSPDIIGFDSGAYTGAMFAILVLGASGLTVGLWSLIGGIATALVVYLLAWRRGISGFRLVIVGICVGAILSAMSTYMVMRAELRLVTAAAWWGAGSLNGTTWGDLRLGLLWVIPLSAALFMVQRSFAMLELGDDAASARGIRVERVRLATMGIGVAFSAAVVSLAGPIPFIALVAPQVARRLAGSAGIALIPTALVGALLLGTSDLAAQRLLGVEVPVGIVTVVIGGVYLIYLLGKEGSKR